jgi:hypothetical protein
MRDQGNLTAEGRALKRAKDSTDVMWHVAVYAIVNIFLWFIDIAQGGGLNWAFWPTIGWGIAVAFHVASYVIDDSGTKGRMYQRFLAEERAKDSSDQA